MKVSDSLPPDPPTKFLDGFALGFPMIRVPDEMERPFESEEASSFERSVAKNIPDGDFYFTCDSLYS